MSLWSKQAKLFKLDTFRWREIKTRERFGGQPCQDRNGRSMPKSQNIEQEAADCTKIEQRSACATAVRPAVSLWTEWSTCRVDCHGGKRYGEQTRQRICYEPKKCGNKKMEQTKNCRSACQKEGKKDFYFERSEFSQAPSLDT